jgi:hypothetical protein
MRLFNGVGIFRMRDLERIALRRPKPDREDRGET